MAFPKYIAWINGTSVAIGSKSEVRKRALETIFTDRFREFNGGQEITLKVTTNGRQLFVSSEKVYCEPMIQN